MDAIPSTARAHRVGPWGLLAVLLFAALVRVGVAIAMPSLHVPDENFQFFEQSHRLAFGYGVVPWEFEQGMRSLLLPWLFSRLLLLNVGLSPDEQIFVQRFVIIAASLLPVAAAWSWGETRSRIHAVVLGVIAAGWFEFVYFAPRPLTEALAASVLLTAIPLAYRVSADNRRAYVIVGALFGICVMLRIHLLAGVAAAAALTCRADWRARWTPLLAGAAIPVAVFGVADWAAWGTPFHSYWAAVRVNVLQSKASGFGTEPWYWYLEEGWHVWGGATAAIVLLACAQPRRNALWLAAAAGIVISHSMIPHKEYRFVYPAFACLVMAAASTTSEWLHAGAGSRRRLSGLTCGVVGAWLATSLALAASVEYRANWSLRRPAIETFAWLHDRSDLCGLLLQDVGWWNTGGYAHLGRDVPIYQRIADETVRQRYAPAFNYILTRRAAAGGVRAPYAVAGCTGGGDRPDDLCIAFRPGACKQIDGLESLRQQRHLDGLGVQSPLRQEDRP